MNKLVQHFGTKINIIKRNQFNVLQLKNQIFTVLDVIELLRKQIF